jgi:hypothetical protein
VGQPLIQPTFAGGELSPSLYARVDIERYGNSVKTGKNFIVRPYGGMVNRPGFQYLGGAKSSVTRTRIIPFIFSTEVSYVVELGHLYMRFWANGAPIESSPGVPFELVSPYTSDEIFDVKFTQSADVVFLAHVAHPPQKLSRVSATEFTLADFPAEEGPFRDINSNEAYKIAVSASNGPVTVTANADIFTADMVGQLLYIETKALGQVKPWTQGDRAAFETDLRRSDGKTYMVTARATGGTDWVECGSFRPVHQNGREWDGPGDQRTNGTQTWAVGIEWEYQDSGYGIVQLTGFTDTSTMTGTVVRRLPQGVVGGLGTPANTWTFNGDGVAKTFAITGRVSLSRGDYQVKINGVLVQNDPNYRPPNPGRDSDGDGRNDFDEP